MKRLRPSHELIFYCPLLLIDEQRPVFVDDLFPQFLETGFHQVRGSLGVQVVNRQFVKLPTQETSFDGGGFRIRQQSFSGLDFQNPQRWLIARERNRHIQSVPTCPSDQFLRRVTPMQAERRFDHGLGQQRPRQAYEKDGTHANNPETPRHAGNLNRSVAIRKARSLRRGFILMEAMLSLSILTVLGLTLLKLSLNILAPRQWIMQQTVTDAYMTYERAYAERIPFENLLANGSPWPAFPDTDVITVEVGRLPGNVPITGTVTRTRIADPGNLTDDGGSGTIATNPAAMKVWKAQSILTYKVGNRTYAKSRTVIRSQ